MADSDRNLRPFESAPGVAFSEALVDYLLQLDVRQYNDRQRKMIFHSTIGRSQATKAKWHGPAPPWDLESDENASRLLPTFYYDFCKRGECWVFKNFRFSSRWRCDPETGNIVALSLDAWLTLMDRQNHFRQARGWPLLQTPCYALVYGSGVCTCDRCPDAPRYSELRGSDEDDADQSTVDSQPQPPGGCQTSGNALPLDAVQSAGQPDARVRRVRFLVASSESPRVRFLVSLADASAGPAASTAAPRSRQPGHVAKPRPILKIKAPGPAPPPPGRAQTGDAASPGRTQGPRATAPPLPPLTSPVQVYSAQFQHTEAPTSFNLASKLVRSRVHRSSKLVSRLEKHLAKPVPAPSDQAAVDSTSITAPVSIGPSPAHSPENPFSDPVDWTNGNKDDSDAYSTDSDTYVSLFNFDDDE